MQEEMSKERRSAFRSPSRLMEEDFWGKDKVDEDDKEEEFRRHWLGRLWDSEVREPHEGVEARFFEFEAAFEA